MESYIEKLSLGKLAKEHHLKNIQLLIESKKREKLNEKDFGDVFSEKEIEEDLKSTQKLKEKFKEYINNLSNEKIE